MLPDLSLSLGRGSSFGLNALNNAARAPQRTMTPEEEDSIAWKVGRAGISGLAAVGNLLDLPVSSVRDTLAGENPLDQWLTPFSDANRVSARDLLRRNGMIGKKDTWGNFFGGMAVDYALDPLTYVSFGTSAMAKAALTKSGKIFKQIGGTAGDVAQLTAKGVGPRIGLGTTTLKAFLEHGDDAAKAVKKTDALEAAKKLGYSLDDEILNQPLRQMGGWGIPFTEIGGTFGDLTKPGVARGIAYGMDAIGEAVKYSAPGRLARMLFDPEAGGFLDESSQKLHAMKYGEKNRAAALAAKNATESGKVINEAFTEFKAAYGDQIDDMLEEGDDPLVKALDLFNRVSRFTSETGDYDQALKLMDLNPVEDVAMRKWATKLNDVLGDPAQANAMTAVWKGFAEGYLGEKAGKWMDENVENIRKASLSQVQNEAARALFQGEQGAQFYSKLSQVVNSPAVGNKTTWEQLRGTLENAGVKKEEIADMGLEKLFAGKKSISKREIQEHLTENAIQIEEVMLGGEQPFTHDMAKRLRDLEFLEGEGAPADPMVALLRGEDGAIRPAEPGEIDQLRAAEQRMIDMEEAGTLPQPAKFTGNTPPGGIPGTDREILLKLPSNKGGDFLEGHFDEPNVIAHVRARDGKLADGRKVFEIIEVQSDWIEKANKIRTGKLRDLYMHENPGIGRPDQGNAAYQKEWKRKFKEWRAAGNESRVPENAGYQQPKPEGWEIADREIKEIDRDLYSIEARVSTAEREYRDILNGAAETIARRANLSHSVSKFSGEIDAAFRSGRGPDRYADGIARVYGDEAARIFRQEYYAAEEAASSAKKAWQAVSKEYDDLADARDALTASNPWMTDDGMPDAPFKQSWPMLAVKHALKYAAENGYDAVTMVKGADIAKVVGGPVDELSTFYDEILTNEIKKYTKKWGAYKTAGSMAGQDPSRQFSSPAWRRIYDRRVFEISPEMRKSILAGQPLYQGTKGATQFLEDGKAVVSIFQNADVTTHLHEFSHVARRHLLPKDLEIASKWAGATGDWTTEHEEKWAKGFEEFMRSGNLPESAPAEIKGIFQRLQAWVVGIYKSLTGTQQADQIPAEIKELYGRIIGTRSRAGVEGKVRTAGEMMQQMNREAFMRLHEMGGTGSLLPDIEGTEHAPGFKHVERYLSPEIARALSPNKPPRLGRVSFGSQMGRTEVIRTVPTEIVNQILDSDVMRTTPTGNLDDAAAEISRKFGNYLGRDEAYGFDPSKPLAGQVLDKSGHARDLAEWASNHRKGRMFNNSRMDDFIKYQQGAQAQLKMYEVIHAFLEKNVLNKGEEGVTVRQAFRDAGMDSERAIKWRWKTKGAGGDTLEQFSKDFGESRVPVEVAAAIKAIQEPFRQADWMRNAGKFMDDVVNGTFKGMFTLPFPAFHGRNLIQGQYMNLAASGHIRTPSDVAEYAATLKDVMRQWQTGAAEAQQLAEEMTAWGALDKRSIAEGIETTGSAYRGVSAGPRSPLTDLAGSWKAADERIGQIQQDWPTPLLDAIPGVTRARVAGQTFMEEGGKLAAVTEWANRATLFSYLRKKGFTAEAAASEVRKMHADYGDLAPFEKVVMRRLIPFYAFQRRMAPVMFETLLDSPSGGLGQTIRALRQSRDDKDALMPDHVAQTTAIPLGGSEDGSKKYLTGFGFPFEQSFSYFDGGVRGGLREAASQLTPIIKAPLEYASGQTFFQAGSGGAGRRLDDLDPTVGRTLSNALGNVDPVDIGRTNEFILANSPLSRFLTVGRKLSDPRKSATEKLLSIGLGINTTDVSIAAQDAVLRDRASDFMREQGARSYERVYFPNWQIDQMENPAAQQQAQELNALQAVLSSRARRRAEAKQKNPLMQAAGR